VTVAPFLGEAGFSVTCDRFPRQQELLSSAMAGRAGFGALPQKYGWPGEAFWAEGAGDRCRVWSKAVKTGCSFLPLAVAQVSPPLKLPVREGTCHFLASSLS